MKKKKVAQTLALVMTFSLFLAACSGAGQRGDTPAGTPSLTTSSAQDTASGENNDAPDGAEGAEEETPYGFPLSSTMYEISLSKETYDALGTLNNACIAAGKKTGETDEDGNEKILYQIISYNGKTVESPAFTGFLPFLGWGGFSIQVEEDGERYDILYDSDAAAVYTTYGNEQGYREIASWCDEERVQLVRYREPAESGAVYVDCLYDVVEGDDYYFHLYNSPTFQASPIRSGKVIISSFYEIGDGEPGWVNYVDVDFWRGETTYHSIHLEDTNWVYAYPFAPVSFGDLRNLIMVRKFTEEADENGNRQPMESGFGLYSLVSEEFIPFPEPYESIYNWPVDSVRHPLSLSGLVMMSETAEDHTRYALYSVPLREKLIDYEDGYGWISLGDFSNADVTDSTMLLTSDPEREKWTWLVATVVEEDTDGGNYQRYISELEPFGIWFDDASSFRDKVAFFKAEDGMCYGLLDTYIYDRWDDDDTKRENREADDRFQICTEPFEADAVFALARYTYGVKQGDQYRILRLKQ